jgi:hypothetical protein
MDVFEQQFQTYESRSSGLRFEDRELEMKRNEL